MTLKIVKTKDTKYMYRWKKTYGTYGIINIIYDHCWSEMIALVYQYSPCPQSFLSASMTGNASFWTIPWTCCVGTASLWRPRGIRRWGVGWDCGIGTCQTLSPCPDGPCRFPGNGATHLKKKFCFNVNNNGKIKNTQKTTVHCKCLLRLNVLRVSYCSGRLVMVPLNMTYLQCLQHFSLNISPIYIIYDTE